MSNTITAAPVRHKNTGVEMFVPKMAKINKVEVMNERETWYEIEYLDKSSLGHTPGQFVEVSIFGVGEAPISISSDPLVEGKFELCVRNAGVVTNKISQLKAGDTVGIRGPFGTGFDVNNFKGKNVLFVAGGLGYAPLRSLINYVRKTRKEYKDVTLLYGTREPKEILYKKEIEELEKGKDINFHITVDRGAEGWTKNVGVITTLIPKVKLDDPKNTIVAVCGPPIMYKFVIMELLGKNIPAENIYISLERRMKCGVGKCGHCQINSVYVCCEGPVFNYAQVRDFKEAI